MGELQSKVRSLQSTVSAVERTAQQQLTTLADHSEVAIDTAQNKLTELDSQLCEFAKFVKVRKHQFLTLSTVHGLRLFNLNLPNN